jgi:phenylpropionate dioxygenase-like ring-hydroxylating dioxygenase large terminal subunit
MSHSQTDGRPFQDGLAAESPVKLDVPMQPGFYFDEAVQAEEMREVFSRCWMFVGFSEQVAEHGQFITAEIGGTSVVIQNFHGEVRALHNVCTHRFATIQQEKCGKRALTCPYHGWTYDKDGTPFIPGNARFFQLDDEQRKARALRRFSLESCGRFLFVRLADQGPGLEEHLGAYADVLRHLSEVFVDQVDDQRSKWETNWKLGVESVLEVYHVGLVHPETFKDFVQPRWEIEVGGVYNNGTAYLSENSAKWWNGARDRLKLRQSQRFPNYDHFFIFPNLAIGLSHGCLMSVQTYTPLTPETNELHYRIFMAGSDLAPGKQAAVRRAVVDNVTTFNRIILAEDQHIMEQVQKGNRQMSMPPMHGSNEARIHKFHTEWHRWMRDAGCLAQQRG